MPCVEDEDRRLAWADLREPWRPSGHGEEFFRPEWSSPGQVRKLARPEDADRHGWFWTWFGEVTGFEYPFGGHNSSIFVHVSNWANAPSSTARRKDRSLWYHVVPGCARPRGLLYNFSSLTIYFTPCSASWGQFVCLFVWLHVMNAWVVDFGQSSYSDHSENNKVQRSLPTEGIWPRPSRIWPKSNPHL